MSWDAMKWDERARIIREREKACPVCAERNRNSL